jgi:hypothetical protein
MLARGIGRDHAAAVVKGGVGSNNFYGKGLVDALAASR